MLKLTRLKHILQNIRWTADGSKEKVFGSLLGCFCGKHTQSPLLLLEFPMSINPLRFKTHTTKGWKTIAKTGHKLKLKENSDIESIACEEGSGAVLHSDLIAELQRCNSVLTQIETFCSLMSLSQDEIERRTLFCHSLEEMLKIYFHNFKLHQFGSSVNGLGFKGCDMDVSLQTLFNNEEPILLKEVPTLESVTNGTTSQETLTHMNPMYMLRFVRRILRQHSDDIREPILFIKARCPILRFYNAKYDVFCDFSCESQWSLRNTKLIRFMCQLDKRFVMLAKIIRYWGKYGGFVGDIDMFNSYAFSLFVIHFLQNTVPPILPPIKEMLDTSSYLNSADVSDVDLMMQEIKIFQESKNSTSVDNLLREFYFYYLNFDFERILLPYSGTSVHKLNFMCGGNAKEAFPFAPMSIQDPFRHSCNTTGVVVYKSCVKFLNSIIQACEAYQDSSNWISGNKVWGICSLFNPPLHDLKVMKERQDKRNHQIKLNAKTNAASKLQCIFEHGLLFHCKKFREDSSDKTKTILKMQCKGYNNTWQGRDALLQNYIKFQNEPLELEHLISKEIVESKTEKTRDILCEFICECRDVSSENQSSLVLDLDFKGTKYPYTLAIFLKEFIPKIFNKL